MAEAVREWSATVAPLSDLQGQPPESKRMFAFAFFSLPQASEGMGEASQ